MTIIHSSNLGALGDCWSTVQYHATKSLTTRIKMSVYDCDGDHRPLLQEILDLIPNNIELVDELATEPTPHWSVIYNKYLPTKIVWSINNITEKMICYQFNSRTMEPPDPQEIYDFLDRAGAAGYRLEDLGDRRPLSVCVDLLSRASMFVGCISGMAEICRAVGTPMRIRRQPDWFYHPAEFTHETSDLKQYKDLSQVDI